MNSSILYTMGTALSRAHDQQVPVSLLVEGQWINGHVAALDGQGLVLDRDGVDHCVVKLERVSAVRLKTAVPTRVEPLSITA